MYMFLVEVSQREHNAVDGDKRSPHRLVINHHDELADAQLLPHEGPPQDHAVYDDFINKNHVFRHENIQNDIDQQHQINLKEGDISDLGIIKTDEDRRLRDEGFRRHAFNELVSTRIGYHRNVTDTRNPL